MFLGLLVGTLCLVKLAFTVMGGRQRYAGFADGGWGGFGERERGRERGCEGRDHRPPPFFANERERGDVRDPNGGTWQHGATVVHAMLRRLQASPAQERAVLSAVDDVRRTVRELRGEAQVAREELARALAEPALDPAVLASARARAEAASHRIADALTAALTEIHAILDERQRRMLGDVIASAWSSRW